ncbi:MAG: hypothetical protein A2487_04400 [Candidatus Raymondbacteria bacterium RifOxyC12_full_50_8]|uniref:Flagellar hook protein FlgE n=1 Tax=Candidatus Raymondbacteria bacterium RIFOXYD12_FULL_49_13 TaxID=1817890 RepID=A0A1F7F0G3_UNCRA|nr:MAG: hypothetical protein A2350_10980 [Candidatus Raymondbacteria bacterium RifOxyB12_full_50_8]OGJ93379.1 MAG: hypothetical protein A2248_21560 [Candidatus Raymondbacteria bacterium RIFOXYA2_FULL_49_16]OGJ98480.1 MAG: hypothetical protein A2487_04400 [Candidatus Raymondbacteria bacterium RifOxyC12_full_50_8]OGK00027.1 MAG: hypothetical protein A2519_22115 [Candidatus Raymondbacteria bacterium RIFOXYD12_FULL_49_13]OGP45016.1 MAG: hypothetical protein A2324_13440 [Candidatus Raymondbacteria b
MFKSLLSISVLILLLSCSKENPVSSGTDEDTDLQDSRNRQISADSLVGTVALNKFNFYQQPVCTTGKPYNMAIEGNGMFVLKQDTSLVFLRRPGSFFLDKDGYLVKELDGPRLMGFVGAPDLSSLASDTGLYLQESLLAPIQTPLYTFASAAQATTMVSLAGNLNADSEGFGCVLFTQPFYHAMGEFNTVSISTGGGDNDFGANGLHHASAPASVSALATDPAFYTATHLTGVRNAGGQNLGIKIGNHLKVTATIQGTLGMDETLTATFTVIDNPAQATKISDCLYNVATLSQFLACMQDFLTGNAWNQGAGSNASGARVAIMPDGSIRVENLGVADGGTSTQDIRNLTVTSDRPISRTYISNAFSFDSTIYANLQNGNNYSDSPDMILRPALATDNIFDYMFFSAGGTGIGNPQAMIYTSTGDLVDVENGDDLIITAFVGSTPKNSSGFTFSTGTLFIHTSTTLQEIFYQIRNTLHLPEYDGTINNNLSVSINQVNTDDDGIPEGAMVIRGQPEQDFSLNNFTMLADNANPNSDAPTRFNANMVTTQLQASRNTGIYSASIEVYDCQGKTHSMTMTFTHTGIKNPGTWNWNVTCSSEASIFSGSSGRITFGLDGSPASFTFTNDSVNKVSLGLKDGTDTLAITFDWGSPGSHGGITQFQSPTSLSAANQDGYAAGRLSSVIVDEQGIVSGAFTNGISKQLFTVALAVFACPEGLLETGNGYFRKTAYSGNPFYCDPLLVGKIHPGAVEADSLLAP